MLLAYSSERNLSTPIFRTLDKVLLSMLLDLQWKFESTLA